MVERPTAFVNPRGARVADYEIPYKSRVQVTFCCAKNNRGSSQADLFRNIYFPNAYLEDAY
jgi:hypothetical protein